MDLPVFFYIDPDYANDPKLEYLDNILLSYTFFESKDNIQLPSPFDPTNRPSKELQRKEVPRATEAGKLVQFNVAEK